MPLHCRDIGSCYKTLDQISSLFSGTWRATLRISQEMPPALAQALLLLVLMTSSSGTASKNPALPYKRWIQPTDTWAQLPAGVSGVYEAVKCSGQAWGVASGPPPCTSLRRPTPRRRNKQTRKQEDSNMPGCAHQVDAPLP